MSGGPRGLIAVAGLHRVHRGSEVALQAIGTQLAGHGHDVVMIGSGPPAPAPYRYRRVKVIDRRRFERWPHVPPLRHEGSYEGLTFLPGAWAATRRERPDYTLVCGYPWESWAVRRRGVPHVFVTQNGDWAPQHRDAEYRFFRADGLVCTHPDYYDRNRDRWPSALIPNGIDADRFTPGPATLWPHLPRPLVLIVSALIATKRVTEAIETLRGSAAGSVVVLGDGPLRAEVEQAGRDAFGDRFERHVVEPSAMPDAYRSADALLHFSREESFGNIYIEAAACGLPVIAHASRLTRWIFEGVSAELVDTDDAEAVRDALARVAAPLDDQGRAPRRPVEETDAVRSRFSWSVVGDQYAAFIAGLL